MAQWQAETQALDPRISSHYEVMFLANGPVANIVSTENPLPVTLGSSNVNIIGNISVPTVISVNSTPGDPVHVHISEIGTSGNLQISYLPIGGNVNVTNLVTVTGNVTANGTVNVGNFPAIQTVNGTINIDNTVQVNVTNFPVTQNVVVTNTPNVNATITGTVTTTAIVSATDAFGRLRVSEPLTLFDSHFRFADNQLWSTSNTATANATFSANEGLINLNVDTTANAEIIRETTKVFSYQPGKSLLIFNTAVFAPAKTNLRQRFGYYGANNGVYLEQTGSTVNFVERSSVTGTMTEIRVPQADWNVDKMDGTGPSGKILDLSKAQILWMDVEWLGLGTVRIGFIIDGVFILCHRFNHANLIMTTYITTASLPLRYEIKNIGATANNSTLKQICSSVISEGGYELRGLQQAVGTPITAPKNLTTAGTYYPVVSIRLKSSPNRLDGIVILTALSLLGITNNAYYNWQVRATATTSGGTWVSAGVNSAVEYNITGTGTTGGRILASGFTAATNQSAAPIDILKEALFKFQLERDGLTGTPYELTLVAAPSTNGADIYASMDWEEISR